MNSKSGFGAQPDGVAEPGFIHLSTATMRPLAGLKYAMTESLQPSPLFT